METTNSLSQLGSFEPHGQCFLWNPDLVLLHAISDSITALAYYSIPIALLYFVRKRQDLPYKWMFVLFGAFILACGTTHVLAVWTIWKPDYWLEGAMKGVTAAASLVAAGLLWPIMPHLLRLPSPAQLATANEELQKEISMRKHVAAELSGMQQYLERQVQERTAELLQANKALRADIAERMRTEEALRKSETKFRTLVETTRDWFWELNENVTYTYASPRIRELLGYVPEEVIGRTPFDLMPPDEARRVAGLFSPILAARKPFTLLENINLHKDGHKVVLETSGTPIFDGQGVFRGYHGTDRDITERKRMEQELRAAAEYNRSLIEASLDPLVTINTGGKITDVNKATEGVTGVPRERLIGSDFSEYCTEPEKARVGYRRVLEEGAVRDYPLTIRHVSGKTTDVLYNAAVYCNQAGDVQGVLATAWDITERKHMQEQGMRMERLAALGQLLGGIAHELRNPLFIITGRLQLMKEMFANREYTEAERSIQIIEDASTRMTMITQRFLQLSRPVAPRWERCSVQDVLTQLLDFLANELMKNRITVVRSDAPDLPPTRSEPRQLHEVFLNIAMNAIQAMTAAHGQGTLTITTLRRDDWIETRLKDDGPGIPPPHRARLFEPFFSTKPPGQGTGLGLWTVRSLLAELNGTVECESVEGQGTTFIVRVPIVMV